MAVTTETLTMEMAAIATVGLKLLIGYAIIVKIMHLTVQYVTKMES